jgi:hypothetical protein
VQCLPVEDIERMIRVVSRNVCFTGSLLQAWTASIAPIVSLPPAFTGIVSGRQETRF